MSYDSVEIDSVPFAVIEDGILSKLVLKKLDGTYLVLEAGGGADAEAILAELQGSAPETLNTIQEIAAALNNDEDVVNSILTSLSEKADSDDVATALAGKADVDHDHDPSTWQQVVNESGASLANWTSVAGTWAADAGGFIKQTNAAAAYYGLRFNTDVDPGGVLVVEAEIRFPSSATTDRRGLLAPASSGSISVTNDPWGGIAENTDNVFIHRGDQATLVEAFTIDEDVWYKVRVTLAGVVVGIQVNDVWVKSGRLNVSSSQADASKLMLVTLSGEVHFRNIKAWRLIGPV